MFRAAWEAPCHSGLQPAALCSLEPGALGRVLCQLWRWRPEAERDLPGSWGFFAPNCSVLLGRPATSQRALRA